jgi:hypothetical protein
MGMLLKRTRADRNCGNVFVFYQPQIKNKTLNIMKTVIAVLFFAMVALNTAPAFAAQSAAPVAAAANTGSASSIEVRSLTSRLKEIHTLSKESLTAEEKASLRKEVVSIDKRFESLAADGVYISVGALILIIILLIILL